MNVWEIQNVIKIYEGYRARSTNESFLLVDLPAIRGRGEQRHCVYGLHCLDLMWEHKH